ncbi:MAG: flagellar hook protein FlgE [Acidobacteria bacterium]|nr:flagellar hook protein FlgE [Acidobacteriota bacterium]
MAVGSFSAGLSGLNANSVYLSVIGNNLANINTVGFKSSSVTFQDLVSQTVGGSSGNPMQVGLGVTTGAISPVFSQGAIENTREATNVAIQGNGFFVVRGASGNSYTRAGNFTFNSDGKLVTPDGQFVQGYTTIDPATGQVITTGQPSDISVPPGILRAPVATTQIRTQTNLDSTAAVGATFTTAVQIYDSIGTPHIATILYTKTAANTWSYEVTVPSTEATGTAGTTAGTVRIGAIGTLTFGGNGTMTAPTADVSLSGPTTWSNGATANAITWDIFEGTTASISQFASTSATSSISQNGSAPGMIDNISISADGTIVATFGAGQTVPVAQLALTSFNNPRGLVKLGSSRYGESQAAGIPNVGVAGSGGRGTLIGSALEGSNVDIAQEFTSMILAQRGYQANSKTITVSDELLLDTLNLKR